MRNNKRQIEGLKIDQNSMNIKSSMTNSKNIVDIKEEKVGIEKKLSFQNTKSEQIASNANKSQSAKGEIFPAAKIQSVTKNIQPSKTKSTTSQPQVVRHKIYQIKPIQMSSSSQSNNSNTLNVSKQIGKIDNEKKSDMKQKDIKAISNVFGQFFKVENLRHYTRPAQTDKVKVQEKSQEKISGRKTELTSKVQTKTYQPRVLSSRESQSIKSLSLKLQQNKEEIKPTLIKSPQKTTIEQNNKLVQEISKVYQNLQSSFIKQVKQTENKDKSLYLHINQTQQIKGQNGQKVIKQERYSQPHFKLLEIDQVTSENIINENKNTINKLQETKSNQPQINFLQLSDNFDNNNNNNKDQQSQLQLKQFINNNQFTHPLIQCQSRDSFPFIQPKQTLSQNATNSNLLEKQIFNKNITNKIQLKHIHSLGNLQPIIINTDYRSVLQEQNVYTPFFQHKIRDSEHFQDRYSKNNDFKDKSIEKEEIIVKDKSQSKIISPIKSISPQKDTDYQNSQLILQKLSQLESNISTLKQSTLQNNIIQNESQVSRIQKMFVKFNTQNKLMIDPLSYEIGFQSLQEVSSNLINEMDKLEQDNFVHDVVVGKQLMWRKILFGKKNNIKNQVSPNKIVQEISFIDSPKKSNFQIKQPKPTQSCSPLKYPSFIEYKQQKNSQQISNNSPQQQQSILIKNKTPLKLPTFDHKKITNHVEQDTDINDLHSFYQEKQTPDIDTLPLQSAQKPIHKNNSPSFRYNQSLTIDEQEPSSISHYAQNQRSNLQQIEQIRQFYNYLRSRESTYYGENSNNNHSPYHDSLPSLCEKEQGEDNGVKDCQKLLKTYQNLHQIKETLKPVIYVQSAIINHQPNNVNNNTSLINKPVTGIIDHQHQTITPTDPIQSPNKLYSKQKKSLESIVLSFRRSNYTGDYKNFKQQVVSLSQSHLNNDHSDPHISFVEQPRQRMHIVKQLTQMQPIHQSFIDDKQIQKLYEKQQHVNKDIHFPLQKIEPIKVISMNKHVNNQKKNCVSKSPQIKDNCVKTSKKIKVVSVNCIPAASKPLQGSLMIKPSQQGPFIIKPPQMSSFLFNSSHIGSFMLNNVIKNYIDTHPVVNNQQKINNKSKQNEIIDSKITKDQEQNKQPPNIQKKKISIRKNQTLSSTKKLSINQKPLNNNKQHKIIRNQDDDNKGQSLHIKLNQQLKQTISRVNQHKQQQLHKLIKSRITERQQNSKELSSTYKSPQSKKINNNDQSNIAQNISSTFNQFIFHSKQINTSRLNNNIHSSHKKPYHSTSKNNNKSLIKSRNSSKSSKKSGIQLWNSNLSQLKSSRKINQNKDTKIFNQQNQRKDNKIIGITKWNQNISKYKQSRSKSNQSHLSSKSSQIKKNTNNTSKIFKNYQSTNQLQQKTMNIEIKKYKYQVSNIQKRYL